MTLDNPRIDEQVLDEISRDKRGKNNLENISEDQDIHASNFNQGPIDLVFDNNWIPVVTKSKRKVKPTFKILSNSKSQMSKGSFKHLHVAKTKIHSNSAALAAQAELSLVAY